MWTYNHTNDLYHHGTKGMKWGQRLYQRKDGSLTALGKMRYGKKGKVQSDAEAETPEQTRSRVLKSTNAKELYKNRSLLTTSELRERIDRINVENQLGKLAAETKKSGFDFIEKALKVGKTINDVYEYTNTPVMKALKKKMGLEKGDDTKEFNVDDVFNNMNKLSDESLKKAASRVENMSKIRKYKEKND